MKIIGYLAELIAHLALIDPNKTEPMTVQSKQQALQHRTVLLQAMVYLIWDYLTDNMSRKRRLPIMGLTTLSHNPAGYRRG
ncbi:hypothetical protein BST96_15255 [Oceanicoccus sagamiensis]|uniref:Uncharacterized protein n=1 Tax=Oceanicoccus sagamiensis TaxID=716816 RepID=A0A1X9NBE1_9GAMM|nr:hypothetical protein BST96_15255 [Oceanicoccus sagamiensis]